jgi:hypothetical protein
VVGALFLSVHLRPPPRGAQVMITGWPGRPSSRRSLLSHMYTSAGERAPHSRCALDAPLRRLDPLCFRPPFVRAAAAVGRDVRHQLFTPRFDPFLLSGNSSREFHVKISLERDLCVF